MKNKVTIKSAQGEYLQHVIFEEQSAQEAWLQMLHDTHAWGKPEHTIELTPMQTIYHEATLPVLDEEGEELEPAVEAYTEVVEATLEVVPSEYLVEIEDITEQVNQEAINREAEEFLNNSDWMVLRSLDGIPMPEGLQEARQQARDRIVR